jgi:CRISPR-associated endonuclease/helicase Cas3
LSPYAYPIHAGLLGHDTLLLVDEAHLSVPFMETVTAIRTRQSRAEHPLKRVQAVRLVPLSATANTKGIPFTLQEDDFANKELTARRTAKKPARLVEAPVRTADRVKVLVRETRDLYGCLRTPTPAVAVIVNRVRTARAVYQQLLAEKKAGGFDLELMIGRSRPLDRDAVAQRVMERAAAGSTGTHERGLIVVATQTIEVGADLDFHGLVTECAAMDALRQRFGRLDRLGKFRRAQAVIVGNSGETQNDPVYGAALIRTWDWLRSVAIQVAGDPVVDFSVVSMQRLMKGVDMTPMNSPVHEQLPLTPAHVDLLSQTSPRPMFEPDVQALLHGLESGLADVQLIWRSDLPFTSDGSLLDASEVGIATSLLTLNPPTSLESLSLPLRDARAWLQEGAEETSLADVEGCPEGEEPNEAGAKPRSVLRRSAERWEHAFPGDIKPGDTVAVPSAYGGCDPFGFDPDYNKAVTDLSVEARRALQKSDLVVITERWLESIGVDSDRSGSIWRALRERRSNQRSAGELLAFLLDEISHLITPDLAWLRRKPVIDVLVSADGKLHALVATEASVRPKDTSDEDFSSSRTVPVPLSEHNTGVAAHARNFAKALCLDEKHVENLERAGGFHDVGKADPRTQEALRAGDRKTLPGQLLAKGLRRSVLERSESAERHEAYSVALLRKYPELLKDVDDPELVEYLSGTHHGRGRALMPDRNDEGTAFTIELAGRTYSFEGAPELGSLGSGWAALFWRMNRRYGPWGIAYLESILRLADWMRSAEEIEMSKS